MDRELEWDRCLMISCLENNSQNDRSGSFEDAFERPACGRDERAGGVWIMSILKE